MDFRSRLARLRATLADKDVDAVLISGAENRYYLSGFHGSFGFLLITSEVAVLATDFRYTEQARHQAPGYRIFQVKGSTTDWFPPLVAEVGPRRLGFEAGNVTFAFYRELTEAIGKARLEIRMVPLEGLVESLRSVKEPEETALIARAVELTDAAFIHVEKIIKAGMTEVALAWEIEKFMRENGSQASPFDLIVAAGPNSARPHHTPSSSTIQAGEPIVIDIGARIEGYASDMTRTFCLGPPDRKYRRVYDTVLGAQLAALAIIKEGMSGAEADSVARAVIEEGGFAEAFGHGLGHGVGLATHEMPRLGAGSTDRLVSGMVFTIEPGIYLSGWGGVRIEDTTVMENGKVRSISQARKVLV